VLKQEPSQPFQSLFFIGAGLSPLVLAYLINSFIQGFDNMEAIENQRGVGAMIFNGRNIRLTHVTAGIFDLLFLIIAEHFVEKKVDGGQAFAISNPDNTCFVKIVYNGRIFMTLAIGDFINTNGL